MFQSLGPLLSLSLFNFSVPEPEGDLGDWQAPLGPNTKLRISPSEERS